LVSGEEHRGTGLRRGLGRSGGGLG
jgi:hypothetical protein